MCVLSFGLDTEKEGIYIMWANFCLQNICDMEEHLVKGASVAMVKVKITFIDPMIAEKKQDLYLSQEP